MGNDIDERVDTLPGSFKMHSSMCMKLKNLVVKIMRIFPDIEEARPGCSWGIQNLCLLNKALEKAKLLLQYCSESSKLYMAVRGESILSRSLRVKTLLEQSLSVIQDMVPVILAAKISEIVQDLRSVEFTLEASEEEAGKAVAEVMRRKVSSSVLLDDIREFHFAAWKLQLSAPKAIVIEKRSLKTLLQKLGEDNLSKSNVLRYLLYLLQKHEQFISRDQKDNSWPRHEESSVVLRCSSEDSVCGSNATQVECSEEHRDRDHESFLLCSGTPPEEFLCPLSRRVMYDPVTISSGQTFERMWIQKWFAEGNDSCPKTKRKLENLLCFPNTELKDLISKWSSKYEVDIEDPSKKPEALRRMESSSNSISSFGSSLCNLRLPSDISSKYIGVSDTSFSCETPPTGKIPKSSAFMPLTAIDDDTGTGLTSSSHSEVEIEPLCGLTDLPWDAQTKVVKDVRNRLEHGGQAPQSLSPQRFLEPLVTYLKKAHEVDSVEDTRAGLDLLRAFLTKNRRAIESLNEDAFRMLSLFLDSEVAQDAMNIVEMLSAHSHGLWETSLSGFISSLLKILKSRTRDMREQAIITLQNLSSSNKLCQEMASLQFVQKLTSFLEQNMLREHCLIILRNLCNTEEGRAYVASASGCLASVAESLESDNLDEQENAVSMLLKLGTRPDYCYSMLNEGINVIPSLVFISKNGSNNAKVRAFELLRILRDVDFGQEQGSSAPAEPTVPQHVSNSVSPRPTASPPKTYSVFGLKFSFHGLKKKR